MRPIADRNIEAIVYNAARIFWNADCETLKAANVLSTMELLRVGSVSPSVQSFVYLSGGGFRRGSEIDDASVARGLESSNGYSQTKFISELLVEGFERDSEDPKKRFHILKPGMNIGTVQEGVANTDDFLWRTVRTAVRLGQYPTNPPGAFLSIIEVDQVAEAVVSCLDKEKDTYVERYGGVRYSEFWKIMSEELQCEMQAVSSEEWVQSAALDVEKSGKSHFLWPFSDCLEQCYRDFGQKKHHGSVEGKEYEGRLRAIGQNLQYLRQIGFFATKRLVEQNAKEETVFHRRSVAAKL